MQQDPMVQVPEHWIPVFHRASLPGHPANPDRHMPDLNPACDGGAACCLTEWPRSASGIPYMPMAGRFIVRQQLGGGRVAHYPREGGVLILGPGGEPGWQPGPPA